MALIASPKALDPCSCFFALIDATQERSGGMIMMTDASVRWEGTLRGAEPGRQKAYSDSSPVRKLEWESGISVITAY
jgi:hypothetical protein